LYVFGFDSKLAARASRFRLETSQIAVTATSGYWAHSFTLAVPIAPAPIRPIWMRSLAPGWPGAANAEHGTKYGAARPAAPAAMAAPRKSRRETGFDSFITSNSL